MHTNRLKNKNFLPGFLSDFVVIRLTNLGLVCGKRERLWLSLLKLEDQLGDRSWPVLQ